MRLQGKRALVTAAGAGIGRAIAERFLDEGADVLACDIDGQAVDRFGHAGRRLDVTDPAAVQALIDEVDRLDILVNAAGVVHSGSILECTEPDWVRAFELNVTAMYRMIRGILPGMVQSGAGSIVNIASVASSIIGVPNRFAYGASKAAVIGLTKSIAVDFVQQGIRCNAICPGTVESPSLAQRIRDQSSAMQLSYEEVYERFASRQPVGRLGRPSEIAALAAYLAADESAFLTGQAIAIDGGWTVQ